jgi:hypothetical protein
MNARVRARVRPLCAGLAVILACGALLAQEPEGQATTLAGMLVGIDEDDDGDFERVYLQTENLGPVLVVNDETGQKLLHMAGSQVEVTGALEDIDDGEFGMQIRVSGYRPIG